MLNKSLFVLFILLFVFACTQLLDEEYLAENSYTGNDGCIYCHTNSARLKVLAEPEESHAGGGG